MLLLEGLVEWSVEMFLGFRTVEEEVESLASGARTVDRH